MKWGSSEDKRLRTAALKNAESVLIARRRAELELLAAKEALEQKTRELQKSEARFRATFAQAAVGIGVCDLQGRFIDANPKFCEILGCSLDELRELTFTEITHPDDLANTEHEVRRLLAGEIPHYVLEKRYLRKDGRFVWSRTTVTLLRRASGEAESFVGVIEDIGARVRAEEAGVAAAQRLQLALAAGDLGDWSWDAKTDVLTLGERAAEIFGVSRHEPLRWEQLRERLLPPDRERDRLAVRKALADGADYRIELQLPLDAPSATRRVVAARGRGVYADNGMPVGMIGVVQDITERIRADEDRDRLGALVTSSDDAIISKTLDGTITTWNRAAERMFGYAAHEVIGKSVTMLIPAEYHDEEPIILGRLRRGERIEHYETVRVKKDGTRFDVSLSVSPIVTPTGEIIGASKIARDITRQRAEIANRERAEAALRETDRRKDEFLAMLAHELRNPLAPIRQAALISKSPVATEAQKRWSHEVINRQVRQMALLLDDLLDISRITRGTLELRTEMTDLATVVGAAVETARPAIDAKRHVLSVELPSERVLFAADPLRVAQVLSNLLTNAAKYTDPAGRIQLRAACVADVVTISVSDSGIGIPAEALADVFAMFSQVKSGQDRSEGGLGIGLALSKGLVALHGGTIEAKSAGVGRGSEFIVRFPRRQLEMSAPVEPEESRIQQSVRRRILIADDNRAAAESLAMLLQMEGHDVQVTYDGQQALDVFTAMRPEIALLDVGMPKINGYDVARQLRQSADGRDVTLIAVTGWGQDSDRAKATAAGFNYHFTKPVEVDRLTELLRSPAALRGQSTAYD